MDRITDLALDYQIMSRYTSFVAVSEEVRNVDGQLVTVEVPVNMPDGVSYDGVFGSEGSGAIFHRNRTAAQAAAPSMSYGVGEGGRASFTLEAVSEEEESGDWYMSDGFYAGIPSVRLSSASPTLGLLPSEVRGSVRALLERINEVYEEFARGFTEEEEPFPTGSVTFVLHVSGDGTVERVSVESSDFEEAATLEEPVADILEEVVMTCTPDSAGEIRVVLVFEQTW